MLRNLFTFIFLFSNCANTVQVNQYIKVIGVDSGKGKYVEIEVADGTKEGDMLILTIANGGCLPHGFDEIKSVGKDKFSMMVAVKEFTKGDPLVYPVKGSEKTAVSLITLNGPQLLVDVEFATNTASSFWARASTPRVETIMGGAAMAFFLYEDPHKAEIKGMKTLLDEKSFQIGIKTTIDGRMGFSSIAKDMRRTLGKDISIALSIY